MIHALLFPSTAILSSIQRYAAIHLIEVVRFEKTCKRHFIGPLDGLLFKQCLVLAIPASKCPVCTRFAVCVA